MGVDGDRAEDAQLDRLGKIRQRRKYVIIESVVTSNKSPQLESSVALWLHHSYTMKALFSSFLISISLSSDLSPLPSSLISFLD